MMRAVVVGIELQRLVVRVGRKGSRPTRGQVRSLTSQDSVSVRIAQGSRKIGLARLGGIAGKGCAPLRNAELRAGINLVQQCPHARNAERVWLDGLDAEAVVVDVGGFAFVGWIPPVAVDTGCQRLFLCLRIRRKCPVRPDRRECRTHRAIWYPPQRRPTRFRSATRAGNRFRRAWTCCRWRNSDSNRNTSSNSLVPGGSPPGPRFSDFPLRADTCHAVRYSRTAGDGYRNGCHPRYRSRCPCRRNGERCCQRRWPALAAQLIAINAVGRIAGAGLIEQRKIGIVWIGGQLWWHSLSSARLRRPCCTGRCCTARHT